MTHEEEFEKFMETDYDKLVFRKYFDHREVAHATWIAALAIGRKQGIEESKDEAIIWAQKTTDNINRARYMEMAVSILKLKEKV